MDMEFNMVEMDIYHMKELSKTINMTGGGEMKTIMESLEMGYMMDGVVSKVKMRSIVDN